MDDSYPAQHVIFNYEYAHDKIHQIVMGDVYFTKNKYVHIKEKTYYCSMSNNEINMTISL